MIDVVHEARIAARSILDSAGNLVDPTLRLGVTGLARAGKTVFITALVQALLEGGRMPLFRAQAEGRLSGGRLAPQPDDAVPRFEVETHLRSLTARDRHWPESTRRIAELRLVLTYASTGFIGRRLGPRRLTLDIVDYPGEWLLDLALLDKDFRSWSRETIARAGEGGRAALAAPWLEFLHGLDPAELAEEETAREAAERFTTFLRDAREVRDAPATLPPGRFLMPGDLAGSPALTFAPLVLPEHGSAPIESLWAMMERRYQSYQTHVVKPFFRDHFARLDRQVVLVDALAALDAGPEAVADLERALSDVLGAFRVGQTGWLASVVRPRIGKILFAATKADHLHHTSHDRLEAILDRIVMAARERANYAGAEVKTLAIAALRATREGVVTQDGQGLPVIVGVPEKGERAGGTVFDGEEEVAVFPGDLPEAPERVFTAEGYRGSRGGVEGDLRFVRFRPPKLVRLPGQPLSLPHIRLDRAIDFLIGDRLD